LTAHHPRNSARKATPYNFFGGVAVGCLVLGCAWTVYANVFAASIYPAVTDNLDVAVVKPTASTGRNAFTVANSTIVMESPPAVAAPAAISPGPALSFDDRFAAAAPQGTLAPHRHLVANARPANLHRRPSPRPGLAAAGLLPPPAAGPEDRAKARLPLSDHGSRMIFP